MALKTLGGLADELWGTDAWVDGARKKDLNVLGDNKQTIRLRQIQQHIELSELR